MLIEQHVYNGLDNTIVLNLTEASVTLLHTSATVPDVEQTSHDHPEFTYAKLTVDKIIDDPADTEKTFDTTVNGSYFDISTPGVVILQLGAAGLKPGRHQAELITKQSGMANGIMWPALMLVVHG